MSYKQIIKKVLFQIKKKNIPIYFKKFLIKMKKHELKTTFNNDDDFISYMVELVHLYHPHAFFMKKLENNTLSKNFNKPTEFILGARVSNIVYCHQSKN